MATSKRQTPRSRQRLAASATGELEHAAPRRSSNLEFIKAATALAVAIAAVLRELYPFLKTWIS